MPPEALYAAAGACNSTQKGNVLRSCASRRKSSARLEEIRSCGDGEFRSAQLFFNIEQAYFENDLYDCACVMRHFYYAVNILQNAVIHARFQHANTEHHVEIVCAELD